MEHWWNDTDKWQLKYSEINLSQYHAVYKKLHADCCRIETGFPFKHTKLINEDGCFL